MSYGPNDSFHFPQKSGLMLSVRPNESFIFQFNVTSAESWSENRPVEMGTATRHGRKTHDKGMKKKAKAILSFDLPSICPGKKR